MALTFRTQVREFSQVTILDIAGRVALGDGSKDLTKEIGQLVLKGRAQIVLNLAEATYFDSSGLGELVSSFSTVKSAGGKLKLLHVPPKIEALLRMTKLETLFERFSDEREAVASFHENSQAASA